MTEAVDLGEALDKIVADLAAKFPTFKTVAAEDEGRKELQVPAIIVQFSGIEPEPDKDPHTGQLSARVRVEARIVMGHRTPQVRREVIKAAAALGVYIQNNRFGVKWGAAEVVGIDPDEFAPIVETHDVWMVEWGHTVDLGDSYFVDEGVTPTEILTSWAPEIGPGNEGSYTPEAPDV